MIWVSRGDHGEIPRISLGEGHSEIPRLLNHGLLDYGYHRGCHVGGYHGKYHGEYCGLPQGVLRGGNTGITG